MVNSGGIPADAVLDPLTLDDGLSKLRINYDPALASIGIDSVGNVDKRGRYAYITVNGKDGFARQQSSTTPSNIADEGKMKYHCNLGDLLNIKYR